MLEGKFRERLIELRLKKDVSAREMSLEMGQSEGYINKIEIGHSMPSMTGFFYICDYFRITPKDFFDDDVSHPLLLQELIKNLNRLDEKQLEHILEIIKDMKRR